MAEEIGLISCGRRLSATFGFRWLPQVVQISIKAAKLVPKGAQRYPNKAKFMANWCPKDRKNVPNGSPLGEIHCSHTSYNVAPENLKIGGHPALFIHEFRVVNAQAEYEKSL